MSSFLIENLYCSNFDFDIYWMKEHKIDDKSEDNFCKMCM